MSSTSKPGNAAPQDLMAKGLGIFSFALGIPQTLAPGRVNRLIGVKDDARSRLIMRAVGQSMVLSPPLVISRAEIDELVAKARSALDLTAAQFGLR